MIRKSLKLHGGPVGLTIVSVISLGVGLFFAVLCLLLRPTAELSRAPEKAKPGTVTYIKGDSAESSGWSKRVQAILDGEPGEYTFLEGDLNAWARSNLRPKPPSKDDTGLVRVKDSPNVRFLEDGDVQVAVHIEAPDLLPGKTFAYQTRGELDDADYDPDFGWVGQCPLPLLNNLLVGSIGEHMQVSEQAQQLAEALEKAELRIDGDQLVVVVQ